MRQRINRSEASNFFYQEEVFRSSKKISPQRRKEFSLWNYFAPRRFMCILLCGKQHILAHRREERKIIAFPRKTIVSLNEKRSKTHISFFSFVKNIKKTRTVVGVLMFGVLLIIEIIKRNSSVPSRHLLSENGGSSYRCVLCF